MAKGIHHLDSTELFSKDFSTLEAQSQIVLALPWTQAKQAEETLEILVSRAGLAADFVMVEDSQKHGPAALINTLFEKSRSRLFGYLAQDVFPSRNWLVQAISAFKKTNAGLLAFNDGKWGGRMASFGLADRLWVDTVYGGQSFFYPGYRQHYGDVELSLIARQEQRYAYDANIVMLEVDYKKEARSVLGGDKKLFAERKLTGFDGRVRDTSLLATFG